MGRSFAEPGLSPNETLIAQLIRAAELLPDGEVLALADSLHDIIRERRRSRYESRPDGVERRSV